MHSIRNSSNNYRTLINVGLSSVTTGTIGALAAFGTRFSSHLASQSISAAFLSSSLSSALTTWSFYTLNEKIGNDPQKSWRVIAHAILSVALGILSSRFVTPYLTSTLLNITITAYSATFFAALAIPTLFFSFNPKIFSHILGLSVLSGSLSSLVAVVSRFTPCIFLQQNPLAAFFSGFIGGGVLGTFTTNIILSKNKKDSKFFQALYWITSFALGLITTAYFTPHIAKVLINRTITPIASAALYTAVNAILGAIAFGIIYVNRTRNAVNEST